MKKKISLLREVYSLTFECLRLTWIPSADSLHSDSRTSVLDVSDGCAQPDVQAIGQSHWHA